MKQRSRETDTKQVRYKQRTLTTREPQTIKKLFEKLAAAVGIILGKDGNEDVDSDLEPTQQNVRRIKNEESKTDRVEEINPEPNQTQKTGIISKSNKQKIQPINITDEKSWFQIRDEIKSNNIEI